MTGCRWGIPGRSSTLRRAQLKTRGGPLEASLKLKAKKDEQEKREETF